LVHSEEPVGFSIYERDRRWARVRSLMKDADIDVIIGVANTGLWGGLQGSVRYLTNLGASNSLTSAVFPADAAVTAVTVIEAHQSRKLWIDEVRPAMFDHFSAIIDRLRELRVHTHRIGIVGLTTSTRLPDGYVAHHGMQRMSEAFPHARFVDATHLMDHARADKSGEELDVLRRAVAFAEGAAVVMADNVRPGTPQSAAYGAIFGYLAENGCELPTMVQWAVGNPHVGTAVAGAPLRPFITGDALRTELEANWGGYHGQITMMKTLRPLSQREEDAFALQMAALEACYRLCRPGVVLRQMYDACTELAKGSQFSCHLMMNGRGLGDDAPLILPQGNTPRMLDWSIQENETFVIKPMVRHPDGSSVQWGGVVAATTAGAKGLGSHRPAILCSDND
jgi:Xaa-Pro dipeptidase